MPRVYLETSIVSYLRQRPSGQVVTAARQLLTRRWWEEERFNYELLTSQYVIDEAADGDPLLAQERLDTLDDIPLLQLGPEIDAIAAEILARAILPPKAQVDALHILPRIHRVLSDLGCFLPIICTPEEMIDDDEIAESVST